MGGDEIIPKICEIHNILQKVNIVYAIGTDVGKTHTIVEICKNTFLKSKKIFTIKPVISGFCDETYQDSDNYKLLQAIGGGTSLQEVKAISRYIFRDATSPDIASWHCGVEIDFSKIIEFCRESIKNAQDGTLFIETAGGVCSPISNRHLMVDISKSLQKYNPCNILVVTEYLGGISHTISALNVLKFDAVIFNRSSADFIRSVYNHLPYQVPFFV